MLDKLAKFIIRHKVAILVVFISLSIVAAVLFFFTKTNSDITSYLPDNSATKVGQDFLRKNFGMDGDMMVIVEDNNDLEQVKKVIGPKVAQVGALDGVTAAMWIGTLSLDQLPDIILQNPKFVEVVDEMFEQLGNFLVQKSDDGKTFYVVMMTLSVSASSDEALTIYDRTADIFSAELSSGRASLGGSVASTKQTLDETLEVMPLFIVTAVAAVMIFLFIVTRSWLEPFILLFSVLVSILLNMGSNIIFSEVSSITQAIAAILQLGLTMDYAIFLMHSYQNNLKRYHDPVTAMKIAIPKTLVTIAASALTTIGGFAAMSFMGLGLGMDMAKVLIKGIILSLITTVMLQPALMLLFKNPLEKGRHAYIHYDFEKPGAAAIKKKGVLSIAVLAVIIVAAWGQTNLTYNYLKISEPPSNPTASEQLALDMGNQIFVALPVDKDDKERNAQYRFVNHVRGMYGDGVVSNIMGFYSMIDQENIAMVTSLFALIERMPDMGEFAEIKEALKSLESFENNGYAMYMIRLTGDTEAPETMSALADITAYLNANFSSEATPYYLTGTPQGIKDLADITPRDQTIVNVLSAVFIFLIVLITLKSLKKTAVVVALIEGGIFINFALWAAFFGEMNFISQLIVSALQLGATVDYAILMSSAYNDFRKRGFAPRNAAMEAVKQSSMSIISSACILILACVSIMALSGNLIIKQVTQLIATGAGLAAVLIIFFLPGLLVYSDVSLKNIGKKIRNRQKFFLSTGELVTYDMYEDKVHRNYIVKPKKAEKELQKLKEDPLAKQKAKKKAKAAKKAAKTTDTEPEG